MKGNQYENVLVLLEMAQFRHYNLENHISKETAPPEVQVKHLDGFSEDFVTFQTEEMAQRFHRYPYLLGMDSTHDISNTDAKLVTVLALDAYCEGTPIFQAVVGACLLYTSPSPRDKRQSRMPSSA